MTSDPRGGLSHVLIIAGYLLTEPTDRDAFVEDGAKAVSLARGAPGCLDFAITADTVDPARINIFERWESEDELLAFRGSGPDSGTAARILGADVKRYVIASVEEP